MIMPLTFANIGETNTVKKVGGKPETRRHLESLGFVAGGSVTVVSASIGSIIVNVKNARIAISEEMAQKIII